MTPHKPFGEMSDAEKGALLLAHHEGKRIELHDHLDGWERCTNPQFLADFIYRIAPEPKVPDSIDWEHVSDDVVAIARCGNDRPASLFSKRPPVLEEGLWIGNSVGCAGLFASYRRGTVEWQDSLVIRPGYEGKP